MGPSISCIQYASSNIVKMFVAFGTTHPTASPRLLASKLSQASVGERMCFVLTGRYMPAVASSRLNFWISQPLTSSYDPPNPPQPPFPVFKVRKVFRKNQERKSTAKMPPKTNLEMAPLCPRCPDKDAADACSFAVASKNFGKCKAEKWHHFHELWPGFINSPAAGSFDSLSEQDCKAILDLAHRSDSPATAVYSSIPVSKQLLDHAYKKIYRPPATQGKTAASNKSGQSDASSASNDSAPFNAGANRPKSNKDDKPVNGTLFTNHFELKCQKDKQLYEYQITGFQEYEQQRDVKLSAPISRRARRSRATLLTTTATTRRNTRNRTKFQ